MVFVKKEKKKFCKNLDVILGSILFVLAEGVNSAHLKLTVL